MTDTYDEAAKVWPSIKKYKKLIAAFLGATAPYVAYLTTGPHPTSEIVAWSSAYVLTLFGVSEAKNG